MLGPDDLRKLIGAECALSDEALIAERDRLAALADLILHQFRDAGRCPARSYGAGLLRLVPMDRIEEAEERAAIREFDGGQDRRGAERGALTDLGIITE